MLEGYQPSEEEVYLIVEIDAERIAPYMETEETQRKLFGVTPKNSFLPPLPRSYRVPVSLLKEHGQIIDRVPIV